MTRRQFLASTAAIAILPAAAPAAAEPAESYASPPAGYAGPYRAWGPPHDELAATGPGRHAWHSEIVPTDHGPFTAVRPHAMEWWDGKAWIGTD